MRKKMIGELGVIKPFWRNMESWRVRDGQLWAHFIIYTSLLVMVILPPMNSLGLSGITMYFLITYFPSVLDLIVRVIIQPSPAVLVFVKTLIIFGAWKSVRNLEIIRFNRFSSKLSILITPSMNRANLDWQPTPRWRFGILTMCLSVIRTYLSRFRFKWGWKRSTRSTTTYTESGGCIVLIKLFSRLQTPV